MQFLTLKSAARAPIDSLREYKPRIRSAVHELRYACRGAGFDAYHRSSTRRTHCTARAASEPSRSLLYPSQCGVREFLSDPVNEICSSKTNMLRKHRVRWKLSQQRTEASSKQLQTTRQEHKTVNSTLESCTFMWVTRFASRVNVLAQTGQALLFSCLARFRSASSSTT